MQEVTHDETETKSALHQFTNKHTSMNTRSLDETVSAVAKKELSERNEVEAETGASCGRTDILTRLNDQYEEFRAVEYASEVK